MKNANAEHKPQKIRHYHYLTSIWVTITLHVFLALLLTALCILGMFYICIKNHIFNIPLNFRGVRVVMFILASVVIGTVLSIILAKFISTPISRLRDAMRRVSDGDFTVQLPVTSNSDLSQLTDDFNKMVREISSIETLRNDFIANVSHEFKTPIATINGYATLLQSENLTESERIEYASAIYDSSNRLSVLITNILRLSKLENQTFSPEQTTFSLDEQLRRCILSLEHDWSAKDIELEIELEDAMITSSKDLLELVWLNLLSNAIKFTDRGGMISVRLSVGSDYAVTIRDTGVGMSEETIEHIFDKFYQGDKSRSDLGNGLGLALVRQVLDILGGSISVKSEPNRGSEFTVRLPIYK